jgi:Protein of unknown function (DUF998)
MDEPPIGRPIASSARGSTRGSQRASTRALIIAGIAAPIVSWGLSVVVMLTWSGYDPVADSISLLADAPMGWLQTLAFLASGVLGAAWAIGLGRVLGATDRDRAIVRGLLLVQAGLAIGFAIFPTDLAARASTFVGAIHLGVFYAYAITMPLTLLALGQLMRRDERWHRLAEPTAITALVVIAATMLVPLTLGGPLTPALGLLERIYVAIPSIWQVVAGLWALRLARD